MMGNFWNEVFKDSRKLSKRLDENDKAARKLEVDIQELMLGVETMNKYKEHTTEMNNAVSQWPRAEILRGIHEDTKLFTELRRENRLLQEAVRDLQTGVDFIMKKYREQSSQLILQNHESNILLTDALVRQKNHDYEIKEMKLMADSKVSEMKEILKAASSEDDDIQRKNNEWTSMLIAENDGLRELLAISKTFGSSYESRSQGSPVTKEKAVQTDMEDVFLGSGDFKNACLNISDDTGREISAAGDYDKELLNSSGSSSSSCSPNAKSLDSEISGSSMNVPIQCSSTNSDEK